MRQTVGWAALAWAAIALGALLPAPAVHAEAVLGDEFVVLLKGVYRPVVNGPDLGLSQVDLSDGSFVKTRIYHVSGLPVPRDKAIGTYYDNFADRDAYRLPGGAISGLFLEFVITDIVEIDGEVYEIGRAELVITEATGIYRSYVGGTIHMEFATRLILDELGEVVGFDEDCLCLVSR